MKHLKTFESFQEPVNEEIFGLGKKDAYKRTVEFLEGDSKEAKEIKDLYDKYLKGKSESEIEDSPRSMGVMKRITQLGTKWAKENKMDSKNYSYKQIRTVLEEDYGRKFKGGPDLSTGE